MTKVYDDRKEAAALAVTILKKCGCRVVHDETVDPTHGVWDVEFATGLWHSSSSLGELCNFAGRLVERRQLMPQRDCSKLTSEQLEFLAGVPGNADVVAELERRRLVSMLGKD